MDAASTFLKEGILGAIIIVEAGVIVFLYKELRSAYDKRITDLDQYKSVFLSTAKDLISSAQGQQKSIDGIVSILQNVKWKK